MSVASEGGVEGQDSAVHVFRASDSVIQERRTEIRELQIRVNEQAISLQGLQEGLAQKRRDLDRLEQGTKNDDRRALVEAFKACSLSKEMIFEEWLMNEGCDTETGWAVLAKLEDAFKDVWTSPVPVMVLQYGKLQLAKVTGLPGFYVGGDPRIDGEHLNFGLPAEEESIHYGFSKDRWASDLSLVVEHSKWPLGVHPIDPTFIYSSPDEIPTGEEGEVLLEAEGARSYIVGTDAITKFISEQFPSYPRQPVNTKFGTMGSAFLAADSGLEALGFLGMCKKFGLPIDRIAPALQQVPEDHLRNKILSHIQENPYPRIESGCAIPALCLTGLAEEEAVLTVADVVSKQWFSGSSMGERLRVAECLFKKYPTVDWDSLVTTALRRQPETDD